MSDLSPERVDELAEVLIRHQRIPLFDGTFGQRCVGCDSLHGESDGPNSPRHAAHIAEALAPLVARWVAEAEVVRTPEEQRTAVCNCIVSWDGVNEQHVWLNGSLLGDCGHPPTGTPYETEEQR